VASFYPAARDLNPFPRLIVSVGLSIAIVPLTGLFLNFTLSGIRLDPMVISLGIFSVLFCLLAQYRRARLSPEERFAVPTVHELREAVSREFFTPDAASRTHRVISLILLVAVIAAALTLVLVITIPKEKEKFTEFFILDKDQMAADYPTHLITGLNNSVFIGITNHEQRTVNYTVETYLMKMTTDESTNTSAISAMDPIDRFTVQVMNNQTVINPGSFTAGSTDYNRVEFLLFNDTVPEDGVTGFDRINRSYRNLHLWVSVKPET
jgi:uncharacterized membrane protein